MNAKDLENAIMLDLATKVVDSLSDEVKQQIIITSLHDKLNNLNFDYEIKTAFSKYAYQYADQFIKEDEIQNRIKNKVKEDMDKCFDKLFDELSKLFITAMKWASDQLDRNQIK